MLIRSAVCWPCLQTRERTGQQIDRRIDAGQLPVELPVNDSTAAAQTHPIAVRTSSTLPDLGLTVGLTFLY